MVWCVSKLILLHATTNVIEMLQRMKYTDMFANPSGFENLKGSQTCQYISKRKSTNIIPKYLWISPSALRHYSKEL